MKELFEFLKEARREKKTPRSHRGNAWGSEKLLTKGEVSRGSGASDRDVGKGSMKSTI